MVKHSHHHPKIKGSSLATAACAGVKCFFTSFKQPSLLQVFKYLAGFDIVVHEMFGQSENCGLLTANIPKRYFDIFSVFIL